MIDYTELIEWLNERIKPHEEKIRLSRSYDMSPTPTDALISVRELKAVREKINDIVKRHCPKCSQLLEYDDQIWDDKALWHCEDCNYSRVEVYPTIKCPKCKGTGQVYYAMLGQGTIDCEVCKGTGKVPKPKEDK